MAEFKLTEKEENKAVEFKAIHKACRPKDEGFFPNYLPYSYKMTPNGIGVGVSIICPYCNEEKDITDVECW